MLKDLQKTSTSDTYGGQSKYIPLEFWEAIKVCFKKYAVFKIDFFDGVTTKIYFSIFSIV